MIPQGTRLFRQFAGGLLHWVYPPICWVCQKCLATGDVSSPLCDLCRKSLSADPHPCCPRCSSTVGPHVVLEGGCIHCRDFKYHFDGVFRMGPYLGSLREVILRMKQPFGEGLTEAIGMLWAQVMLPRLQPLRPDAVVPIPLHWSRRWARGYNQSEVLARSLAQELRVPCGHRWLRRIKRTPQQITQTPAGRLENVRGAFALGGCPALHGKRILLVDDVLTTGSTASEAARALRFDSAFPDLRGGSRSWFGDLKKFSLSQETFPRMLLVLQVRDFLWIR